MKSVTRDLLKTRRRKPTITICFKRVRELKKKTGRVSLVPIRRGVLRAQQQHDVQGVASGVAGDAEHVPVGPDESQAGGGAQGGRRGGGGERQGGGEVETRCADSRVSIPRTCNSTTSSSRDNCAVCIPYPIAIPYSTLPS